MPRQAAIAADPGQGSFDDPALGQDGAAADGLVRDGLLRDCTVAEDRALFRKKQLREYLLGSAPKNPSVSAT
jgi:hypothetical protein